MVLVTHKLQGSHVSFPLRSSSWSKSLILKRRITTLHVVGRGEKHLSAKPNLHLSVGASYHGPLKVKSLRISSFKGGAQNNNSEGRRSGTKVSNDSVKVSYLPEESPPLSYAHETEESATASRAIHKLFKKWLMMLRTQSPCQVEGEVVGEKALPTETLETQDETPSTGKVGVAKSIWSHFWSLDATIKLPLLLFFPGFVAVNIIYGAEVSKDLTPLWVLGPLVTALYIQMFRGLCVLYAFSFKQTVQTVRNLPVYYMLAYNYLAQGKLKEDIRAHLVQPIVDIQNMDYKEFSRVKTKELLEWMKERYLDYVESIWPLYCRTIRFLKRANLI